MTQAKQPNIYQRIHAVMQEVGYVQKDATVEAGGGRSYKGVSHDAVVAALRPAMVKHGIVLHVTQIEEKAVEGQTARGYPKIRYEAWYEIALVNIDSPDDRAVYRMHAHAEDGGDKAPGKSVSYAVKTVLLKAFDLETGENDESRYLPDEPAYVTDEQAATIQALAEEVGADIPAFCNWLKVDSIETIPANKHERAVKALEKKRKQEA